VCRLLGLNAGRHPVRASFWLADAPDSLEVQSHRNVDGSGIGFFGSSGAPVVDKQPEPAFASQEFVREAKQARSVTFIAHVRYATAGNRTVGAGITAAARWIAERLPLSSLNAIVATAGELWALRYPGQHALHVIERPAGASSPPAPGSPAAAGVLATTGSPPGTAATGLHARSATSSVHAPELHTLPSVVVASERLDGEQGWRMLAPGELVHVRPDLTVESAMVLPEAPAHLVPLPAGNPNIDT
jgi:predicted glutamine amidotransferase